MALLELTGNGRSAVSGGAAAAEHGAWKTAASPARLEARKVSWGPAGQPSVLHETSVLLEPGSILGVIGPNGAGKSTFLRLLYRYYRPRTGQILVDGQDVWSLDAKAAARLIGVVLQEHPAELSLSVREVVALGRTPHRRGFSLGGSQDASVVDGVLSRLELGDLGERQIGSLSGGERQRVMVARALAQEPRILVLDEPSNHLDIRHEMELLELLRSLGLTIVCSLHDLNLALGYADVVLALAEGRTLAFGPSADVLSPNLISDAFSVEARVETLVPSGQRRLTFQLQGGFR